MVRHGVRLELNDGVAGFEQSADGALVVLTASGKRLPADIVILAIGVRPETALAKMAGIEIGQRGGIRVDEQMRTSDPDIFAVGDAVEVRDFVTGQWTLIPLAGPANRQGRIAAEVIVGRDSRYPRHTGHLDLPDLRGCDRLDRRQREGPEPDRGHGFRENLPLPEFARGLLSGRQIHRDESHLPQIRRTPAGCADARRGRRSQADRRFGDGDPGRLHHLRPGRGRAEPMHRPSAAQRIPSTSQGWSRGYPARRYADHPLGRCGRRLRPRRAPAG